MHGPVAGPHAALPAMPHAAWTTTYGKTYKGNERTTFIIDSDGKVAEVLRKVKPAEHDALVLAALEELSR